MLKHLILTIHQINELFIINLFDYLRLIIVYYCNGRTVLRFTAFVWVADFVTATLTLSRVPTFSVLD